MDVHPELYGFETVEGSGPPGPTWEERRQDWAEYGKALGCGAVMFSLALFIGVLFAVLVLVVVFSI